MKLIDRILILFVTIFWFVLGVFFFRTYWLAALPALAFVYVLIGGRIHV